MSLGQYFKGNIAIWNPWFPLEDLIVILFQVFLGFFFFGVEGETDIEAYEHLSEMILCVI